MANGIDWFRWHHGSASDPKFMLVARKSGTSLPEVIAIWVYLLEHASAANDRGVFGVIDHEAVDCLYGFPETETRTKDIMAAMEERGLISNCMIVNWEKRQVKREREDSSAARVAKYRASGNHVTPCNASDSQKKPREEESREDIKAGATKATRLSADWVLPKDWGNWALDEKPEWGREEILKVAEDFRDYWIAKAGRDGTKLDWLATWRKWVRNARKPQ